MAADPIDPEVVNTGTYDDDGTGDNLRGAFDKLNLNGLTLGRHANDRENPHGVTAHQVGAYTQAEVDALVASLGTLSDLLVLLGQIDTIAKGVRDAAGAANGDAAGAHVDRLATAADAVATAADRAATAAARTAAEGARDTTQGYRDTAKTYRDQAQAAAGSVDTTNFVKKDGSTPFTGAQPFNAGLNLKPGAASAAPANGDLTADATGAPAARVSGSTQALALRTDAARRALFLGR